MIVKIQIPKIVGSHIKIDLVDEPNEKFIVKFPR